jgi:hypothetical protein
MPGVVPPTGPVPQTVPTQIVGKPARGWKKRVEVATGVFTLTTTGWAEIREAGERVFPQFAANFGIPATLPWKAPGMYYHSPSNMCRVLYMSIIEFWVIGVVGFQHDLTANPKGGDGKAFYQITLVEVPKDKLHDFNMGMFPSVQYLRDTDQKTRSKTVKKQWETAGFDELPMPDGGVWFKFNTATHAKQKTQQSTKRKADDISHA